MGSYLENLLANSIFSFVLWYFFAIHRNLRVIVFFNLRTFYTKYLYIKAHNTVTFYHVGTFKFLGICKPCWFHPLYTIKDILIDDRAIHVYKNRSCQMWVLYKLFLFSPVLGKKYDFLFRFPQKIYVFISYLR